MSFRLSFVNGGFRTLFLWGTTLHYCMFVAEHFDTN